MFRDRDNDRRICGISKGCDILDSKRVKCVPVGLLEVVVARIGASVEMDVEARSELGELDLRRHLHVQYQKASSNRATSRLERTSRLSKHREELVAKFLYKKTGDSARTGRRLWDAPSVTTANEDHHRAL